MGGDGAVHGRSRLTSARLQTLQLPGTLLEDRTLLPERLERPPMLLHAVAIDAVEGRGGSIRPAQVSEIADVEQHAPVAHATHLVQLDQASLEIRRLTLGVRLQRLRSLRRAC